MKLRILANQVSNAINQNVAVSLQLSAGYVIGTGQRQVPVYQAAIVGPAQVQALDNSDLKQVEGLNLQGSIRALYMYGNLAGVIRPDSRGGDLITLPDGSVWLTVKALESWPDWTKVCIVKQADVLKQTSTNSVTLAITSPVAGDFSWPHGLSGVPTLVSVLPKSNGQLWQTQFPDATNIYLGASLAGVSAAVFVSL